MDIFLFIFCCIFGILHLIFFIIFLMYDNLIPDFILCIVFLLCLFLYFTFNGDSLGKWI